MTTAAKVVVGSDVLEIMSIAMYAEPLVLYRELLQNSADSLEGAIAAGVIAPENARVTVEFELTSRTVIVRDNGLGLPNDDFDQQMLAFGASVKRSGSFRGFRGIGRLAGLGHCKRLVFRSRGIGDGYVCEANWSGHRVRQLIAERDVISLEEVAEAAIELRRKPATDEPSHFFEVRLEGVRRLSDDRLFDRFRIAAFLADVAPVPFSPTFSYGRRIREEILRRAPLLEIQLTVGNTLVMKPYSDEVEVRAGRFARITEIEPVELPSVDGATAAFGWIAHHDYLGAFRPGTPGRGLRVRSGNLQIGDESLLAPAFPESRFNAWSIGEFHIFDARLRPNARRDAFEPSPHVEHLYNQLAPFAGVVARRCRAASRERNQLRTDDSVAAPFEAVAQALTRDTSPLALALRVFIGRRALLELNADPNRLERMANPRFASLYRRAERFAKTSTKGRPTAKDQGRLDVLSRLYEGGHGALIAEIISALRCRA